MEEILKKQTAELYFFFGVKYFFQDYFWADLYA